MNKSTLDGIWNSTRRKYGIYLRLLETLPEGRLHDEVIPEMRTPAELVAHTSGAIVRGIARGVASGRIDESRPEAEVAAELGTKADLLDFARRCWEEADEAIATVGDDELTTMLTTPWGIEFPGRSGIHLLNDEFTHHRGQLYVYARACGVEPPWLWSFEQNPPGFGPNA